MKQDRLILDRQVVQIVPKFCYLFNIKSYNTNIVLLLVVLVASVVAKDLRLKDKDLMSKDEDKDKDLSFEDKDKDLHRH